MSKVATTNTAQPAVTAELRVLSEKATPGPWCISCEALMRGISGPTTCVVSDCPPGYGGKWKNDADFIVAAVNYVRDLIARNECHEETSEHYKPFAAVIEARKIAESRMGLFHEALLEKASLRALRVSKTKNF